MKFVINNKNKGIQPSEKWVDHHKASKITVGLNEP